MAMKVVKGVKQCEDGGGCQVVVQHRASSSSGGKGCRAALATGEGVTHGSSKGMQVVEMTSTRPQWRYWRMSGDSGSSGRCQAMMVWRVQSESGDEGCSTWW
ncbi:MYND type zinc finger protein [Sesbania bispinosa]|nr:MYND type zinc finger protein [Sesbania bispinosa]